MRLENGYTMKSTFPMDFTIADLYGSKAIKDTFRRAFKEWKSNHIYLTELVITLNLKTWQYYEAGNEAYSKLYQDLWGLADSYATNHLKGKELEHFYNTTD